MEERESVLRELPLLKLRERGETFRRFFPRLELYWDREFVPARKKPDRPRRTNRPGRYRYSLKRDLIEWKVAATDLVGSS